LLAIVKRFDRRRRDHIFFPSPVEFNWFLFAYEFREDRIAPGASPSSIVDRKSIPQQSQQAAPRHEYSPKFSVLQTGFRPRRPDLHKQYVNVVGAVWGCSATTLFISKDLNNSVGLLCAHLKYFTSTGPELGDKLIIRHLTNMFRDGSAHGNKTRFKVSLTI
jgi:hypothetical protein